MTYSYRIWKYCEDKCIYIVQHGNGIHAAHIANPETKVFIKVNVPFSKAVILMHFKDKQGQNKKNVNVIVDNRH